MAALSGRRHTVYTAVVLGQADGTITGHVTGTGVVFRRLNGAVIAAYLARVPVLDKAGAYSAQDDENSLIARIDGSFSNVIGFPVETVARLLRSARWAR